MGFARKQRTKRVPKRVPASNLSEAAPMTPYMFLADVKAAGKQMYHQMLLLLLDYTERGLHPGLITRAEELFEGRRDLLVAFNTFLPKECQCTVPE